MDKGEQIISMLENLTSTVSTLVTKVDNLEQGQVKLEQGQAELKQDVSDLKQGQSELKQGQSELKQGQVRLEIIIENDIKPGIKVIAEGHGAINKKLDDLKDINEKVLRLQDSDTVQNVAIKELSKRTANL